MSNIDDDSDNLDEAESSAGSGKGKKLIFIVVPTIIIIAGIASFFTIFSDSSSSSSSNDPTIVKSSVSSSGGVVVFYDLPEITVQIKDSAGVMEDLKIKLNMELTSNEDSKAIEPLIPRIIDVIITHTVELNSNEVSGISNLYWLKEELLHRINLSVAPIRVSNLNFKTFEISKRGN
ncbi:MAG: flagellar basal body-associated FliL family protein [Lactobacillus sp.]|jgi:flagellar FliL protein|nr:flagellar basal body-associated FliL family protein [Lactobacillus sp.]